MKMILLIEIGRHQVIVKSSWFEVSSKKTRLTLTFTDWVKEESSATNRRAARVGSDVAEDLGRVCALVAEDPCKIHVCALVNADVCALVNADVCALVNAEVCALANAGDGIVRANSNFSGGSNTKDCTGIIVSDVVGEFVSQVVVQVVVQVAGQVNREIIVKEASQVKIGGTSRWKL